MRQPQNAADYALIPLVVDQKVNTTAIKNAKNPETTLYNPCILRKLENGLYRESYT